MHLSPVSRQVAESYFRINGKVRGIFIRCPSLSVPHIISSYKKPSRWGLLQLLQSVEPSCNDPLLVIYYIAPSSALAMTPMALLDILDEDLKGSMLTPWSIAQVIMLIFGTACFSFGLIFAEVSPSRNSAKHLHGACVFLSVMGNEDESGRGVHFVASFSSRKIRRPLGMWSLVQERLHRSRYYRRVFDTGKYYVV